MKFHFPGVVDPPYILVVCPCLHRLLPVSAKAKGTRLKVIAALRCMDRSKWCSSAKAPPFHFTSGNLLH